IRGAQFAIAPRCMKMRDPKPLRHLAVVVAVTASVAIAAVAGSVGRAGTGWDTFGTPGKGVNQFAGPVGIFVNSSGHIFVTDGRNSRIVRVNDMAGRGWTTFGTRGEGVHQFSFPFAVFVNPTGQIFVADIYRLVRINDMTGSGWTTFDTYTIRGADHWYWSPTGIFVTPVGQIFMTDLGNQRIVRINDMAGTGRTIFNTVGPCTFTSSPGIFVRAGEEITVADYANSRIMRATAPPPAPPAPEPKLGPPPPNCTPPPATTGPQQPTPESQFSPLAAQDEIKGVYQGPLGNFLVTPRETSAWPPCPQPSRPAKNYKTSELYSPVFGDLEGLWECANGRMLLIGRYILEPDGYPISIGKGYFVGPAKVPFEASLDRLVLLTVAGKPAIAQIPLSGPGLTLVVIERFPSGDQPGIQVVVERTDQSLEETVALAAKIMGVRP